MGPEPGCRLLASLRQQLSTSEAGAPPWPNPWSAPGVWSQRWFTRPTPARELHQTLGITVQSSSSTRAWTPRPTPDALTTPPVLHIKGLTVHVIFSTHRLQNHNFANQLHLPGIFDTDDHDCTDNFSFDPIIWDAHCRCFWTCVGLSSNTRTTAVSLGTRAISVSFSLFSEIVTHETLPQIWEQARSISFRLNRISSVAAQWMTTNVDFLWWRRIMEIFTDHLTYLYTHTILASCQYCRHEETLQEFSSVAGNKLIEFMLLGQAFCQYCTLESLRLQAFLPILSLRF